MGTPTQQRLPLAPLLIVWGEVCADGGTHGTHRNEQSDGIYAEAFGVSRRALSRWRTDGIPLFSADALCCRVGMHPTEVWGMKFYEGVEDTDGISLDDVA